jgi:hypothetical protein
LTVRSSDVDHAVMAKTVITTDDVDGSAGAKAVAFSYNGASYSIDLGKKNQAAFEKALKPWIDAATKTSGRGARKTSSARRRSASSQDLATVREWAGKHGHKVAARGRISQTVIDAYGAAN